MKADLSFLVPNNYISFVLALVSGSVFYGALFYANQYWDISISRMVGPLESNPASIPIYIFLYILFFWGIITLTFKNFLLRREQQAISVLEKDLPSSRIISQRSEVDSIRNAIVHGSHSSKFRHSVLAKTLLFLIDHCLVTETSDRVNEIFGRRLETLEKHIDSSYNILRYIAWAIPSLGFIGTVMGIGSALSTVELAMQDMNLVTRPLGMAFDTTLIALCESMVLMLLLYSTQRREEDLLNSIDLFCQEKFIINLRLE